MAQRLIHSYNTYLCMHFAELGAKAIELIFHLALLSSFLGFLEIRNYSTIFQLCISYFGCCPRAPKPFKLKIQTADDIIKQIRLS